MIEHNWRTVSGTKYTSYNPNNGYFQCMNCGCVRRLFPKYPDEYYEVGKFEKSYVSPRCRKLVDISDAKFTNGATRMIKQAIMDYNNNK